MAIWNTKEGEEKRKNGKGAKDKADFRLQIGIGCVEQIWEGKADDEAEAKVSKRLADYSGKQLTLSRC